MALLIAYATKHGVTEKCAKALKTSLAGGADLVNLKDRTPNLAKYDAVILGASVYAGVPRKQIKAFVAQHAQVLKKKKLGLFLCCQADGEQAEKQMDAAFTPELRREATAQGVLGNGFQVDTMNFLEKFVIKKVSGKAPEDSFTINKDVFDAFERAFGQA